MPEPQEYEKSAILLRRVASLLYASPKAENSITLEHLYQEFSEEDTLPVGSALRRMEHHGLLELELKGSRIGLTGTGKSAFAQNCVAEIVLGQDYIAKKYRSAIVHIIVEGTDTPETGGTGFFSVDFPNAVVTAGHVVTPRILRIEDTSGSTLSLQGEPKFAPGELDLAILECPMPSGIEPIRVEWNSQAISSRADLLIFGYPEIAFHHPSLYQARAELHTISQKYSLRDSLIISGTHPGCSGGPVVDMRGFAIGVIEQENILERKGGTNTYFSAIPTHYLREIDCG